MPTGIDPRAATSAAARAGIPRAYGDRPLTDATLSAYVADSPCLRG